MSSGRSKQAGRAIAASALALALLVGSVAPVQANDHDPQRTGHPMRIVAYIVSPVGVLLDYIIFRPAHWLGNREPFKTIFMHDDN